MRVTHGSAHQLVLLRHAKAEHPGSLDDQLRPLALTGRKQATEVGTGLRAAGLVPDLALVSSALRTRQTWDLVRAGLEVPAETARLSDDVYAAGIRQLLGLLRGLDESAGTVLVVGHEPTVSQTAAALAGPGSDDAALARVRVGVATASYSVLEVPSAWAALEPDGARLLRVVDPA